MGKISVKNSKAFDFGVPVHIEKKQSATIDQVVADLRELSESEFKYAIKIAKNYRKADKMLSDVSPEVYGGMYED